MRDRLIGYTGTNQYILWNPHYRVPLYARDVTINEWDTEYEGASAEFVQEEDDLSHLHLVSENLQTNVIEPGEAPDVRPTAPTTGPVSTIDVNDVVDDYYGINEGENIVDFFLNIRDSDYAAQSHGTSSQLNLPAALN